MGKEKEEAEEWLFLIENIAEVRSELR